jgi:siderophore synthetase component
VGGPGGSEGGHGGGRPGGRFPDRAEVLTAGGWRPLTLEGLVALAGAELRARTGVSNRSLAGEIAHSRDVVAALLAARRRAVPPDDPYLRSEQALVAGHRYHPAPKARGGGGPREWLPYAPEAHARFALELLAVPEELVVEEGETGTLDGLGPPPPPGCRLLPAHPWQLRLLGRRLRGLARLGHSTARAAPTSSVRTVYLPEPDLFCKFSLDVRITNDVRRLWLRDLRWLTAVDGLLRTVFDDLPAYVPRPAVLSDRGFRSVTLSGRDGGTDGGEALAVVARDGLRAHLGPGVTPLLAAGISEGFPGNPLDRLDPRGAGAWWQGYLDRLVPPALHAFLRHGLVLECHLQNVLVGVDAVTGAPARVLFRDHEGVKLVADRHRGLLDGRPAGRAVSAAHGWERLVYCLVVNNLSEIAGAIGERHPSVLPELWQRARATVEGCAGDLGDPPELRSLLSAAHVPAKANLLLRWTGADGCAMRSVPVPNPLLPALAHRSNRLV